MVGFAATHTLLSACQQSLRLLFMSGSKCENQSRLFFMLPRPGYAHHRRVAFPVVGRWREGAAGYARVTPCVHVCAQAWWRACVRAGEGGEVVVCVWGRAGGGACACSAWLSARTMPFAHPIQERFQSRRSNAPGAPQRHAHAAGVHMRGAR